MNFIYKLSAKILPNIKTKRPGLRMNIKMFVLGSSVTALACIFSLA